MYVHIDLQFFNNGYTTSDFYKKTYTLDLQDSFFIKKGCLAAAFFCN